MILRVTLLSSVYALHIFGTFAQEFTNAKDTMSIPTRNEKEARQSFREIAWEEKSTTNPAYLKKSTEMYANYHRERGNKCTGCRYVKKVLKLLPSVTSVLDAGCANGKTVRMFLDAGKEARGIEIYAEPLKYAKDLVARGVIKQQAIIDLDAPTASFDLVYNTDVLEHIPPGDTLLAVCQLVRVTKKYLFVIVGMNEKNSRYGDTLSDPWVHEVIRSSQWWQDVFEQFGAKLEPMLMKKYGLSHINKEDNVMILERSSNAVSDCSNVKGRFDWKG